MTLTLLFLFAALLTLVTVRLHRRVAEVERRRSAPARHSRPRTAVPGLAAELRAPPPEGASAAPELETLDWEPLSPDPAPRRLHPARARIRDRYIAARFRGQFKSGADLDEVERVIKVARLYFEENKIARANELLQLAIQQVADSRALRLARLEIAFLARDGASFTRWAGEFREQNPTAPEWADISRLGRIIAPGQTIFGAKAAPRSHEHYGPWPDMPNWIQASWDLTSEILAADFHVAAVRDSQPATALARSA